MNAIIERLENVERAFGSERTTALNRCLHWAKAERPDILRTFLPDLAEDAERFDPSVKEEVEAAILLNTEPAAQYHIVERAVVCA